MLWQNKKKGENESPSIRCGCDSYFSGAGVSVVSVVVFFVFFAPFFLVLLFFVVLVVTFFSGAGAVVVVVVVVDFSSWAKVAVPNATLINTATANINTFFIFFSLSRVSYPIMNTMHYICH